MSVAYKTFDEFPGWDEAPAFIQSIIRQERNAVSVLEIGAGANPTLSPDHIRRLGVEYTANDVNDGELAKADPAYKKLNLDLCAGDLGPDLSDRYDIIFSRMVNEHVRDGQQYFSNIYQLLKPNGVTVHCFSTLYALPFLVNRLVPESVSGFLLNVFNPRDRDQHDKFPAHYSWSRGPSSKSIGRFQDIGFEVEEYVGYFGHNYYDSKLAWLSKLERAKARVLRDYLKLPLLTSYASIVLRKPSESSHRCGLAN